MENHTNVDSTKKGNYHLMGGAFISDEKQEVKIPPEKSIDVQRPPLEDCIVIKTELYNVKRDKKGNVIGRTTLAGEVLTQEGTSR